MTCLPPYKESPAPVTAGGCEWEAMIRHVGVGVRVMGRNRRRRMRQQGRRETKERGRAAKPRAAIAGGARWTMAGDVLNGH